MITHYAACLDSVKIGRGFEVFVSVALSVRDRATITSFEEAVCDLPEVVEAHRLFGEVDYRLRVAVADAEAYERCYTNKLAMLPGVAQLVSHPLMKVVVPRRAGLNSA